jgi:hypothetical protein
MGDMDWGKGSNRVQGAPGSIEGEPTFPKEADTLTGHGLTTLRRDTLPIPSEARPSDYDDTQTQLIVGVSRNDDPTSPTLDLGSRSSDAREVYRRFLESEYAPALALANELIAQGDDDPMLVMIARECRASLVVAAPRAPRGEPSSSPCPSRFAHVDPKMTLEELAATTGMSLEQMLRLLDRFVELGALSSST